MQTYISHSEAETESIGEKFAKDLPDGTVIAMYGDLGAGKTAFVRGMAKGMGLTCRVSSPTFTIVNEYIGERELIHFDMYRLESADELFDIGWEDYLRRGAVRRRMERKGRGCVFRRRDRPAYRKARRQRKKDHH